MFFFLAATRRQRQGLATDLSIEKNAVAVTIEISLVRYCVRNCRGAARRVETWCGSDENMETLFD